MQAKDSSSGICLTSGVVRFYALTSAKCKLTQCNALCSYTTARDMAILDERPFSDTGVVLPGTQGVNTPTFAKHPLVSSPDNPLISHRVCWMLLLQCFHEVSSVVAWWCSGSVLDSRPRGPGFNSRPVHRQAATLGKLIIPMCLCHQAVQFGTGQRAVMLCGREGNRRSGVALAMRHRL